MVPSSPTCVRLFTIISSDGSDCSLSEKNAIVSWVIYSLFFGVGFIKSPHLLLRDNITFIFSDLSLHRGSMKILSLIILLIVAPGLVVAGPLSVFVSVLPQKYFVEQIGGEHVAV